MPRKYFHHDAEQLPGPHMRRGMPRVELEILKGRARNRVRLVTGAAYLIGAAADCDLVLGDPRFPEAHSYLMLSPESVALRWLGLGPEVTRNGLLLGRAMLEDGDLLQTGPYQFRVSIEYREPSPKLSRSQAPGDDEDYGADDFDAGISDIRNLLGEIRRALRPAVEPPRRMQRIA